MIYGQLMCKNTRLVTFSTERQHTIISDVHKRLGHNLNAKAMASHCGRDSTMQKISNIFFWLLRNVTNVRSRENLSNELHHIPIKT